MSIKKFLRFSLSNKIKLLLFAVIIPMVVLVILLLTVFIKYSNQYNRIIQNLTIASEFSFDFKEKVDYNMYRYAVNSKNFDTYSPLEDVAAARSVLLRLNQTTTRTDNLRRLRAIERFLDNLEKGIIEMRDTQGYEFHMSRLDINIRVLTTLVQEWMQEYIYYETINLAEVRSQTNAEIRNVAIILGVLSGALVVILFFMAMRISDSITKPIKVLSKQIRMVGEGDFTVRPTEGQSDEVRALSEAFNSMVTQIGTLMENVRQEQDNLRGTELRLLQAQINPHFLYNTFDTVIWLSEDNQNEQVIQVITSLSAFFRTSLSRGEDIITVREEALHIKSYLEIQQVRYRDLLSFEIDIPDELNRYAIPKLTLQPLVENALYHGIKNKRGLGKIRVHSWRTGDSVFFSVWDDGIGMLPEDLAALRESLHSGNRKSFGMSNVFQRIQLYYGDAYGLQIESVYGEFTQVLVTLPIKEIVEKKI